MSAASPPTAAPSEPRASTPARRRRVPLALRALRVWFALAGRAMPGLAERQAARLFLTPLRRTPRAPSFPGATARDITLTIEGQTLVGWSWGEGPLVLLVHGWSGRGADMVVLAEALVRAGYEAVVFDMPAHGHSPGRRTSLAEWRRVLPALGRALAAARGGSAEAGSDGGLHAVVAHSFGATATTLALAAGLRVRGVALLAPAPGPRYYLERVSRHIGLPAGRIAGMERVLVRMVGQELPAFDASRAAASLEAPALILHDPADPEVSWSHVSELAAAWRGSTLVAAPGVGHFGVLTAPESIARVTDFVRALGPPASA